MQLAHYQLEEEVGRGGAGVVFRARDTKLGRRVAVKVLTRVDRERTLQRFQQEGRVLARLRHPHLVSLLDVGQDPEGRPFLVLDWVEGESLAERLRRDGPLDPRPAVELALQLARALEHAHAARVLHRDLKPDNVMLEDGRALLTDFGLAKQLDPDAERLSVTGSFLGTPGYWPPEQAAGDLAQVGPRSDVYGLGATLYAALTGRAPLEPRQLALHLHHVQEVDPPPPSELRRGIDPALDALCLRCLAKAPADRFPSAAALAAALEGYLRGDPQPAPAGRVVPILAGACALLLAACLGLAWRQRDLARELEAARARVAELEAGAPATPEAGPTPQPAPDGAPPAEDPGQRPDDPADRADELLRRAMEAGDAAAALPLLDAGLAADPEHLRLYQVRSRTRAELGDRQGALADARRAQELAPESARTHLDVGKVLDGLQRPLEALEHFQRALDLSEDHTPLRADALVGLARGSYAQGRRERAWELTEAALLIDPAHRDALLGRASMRRDRGELELAIEDLRAVLRARPDDARVWNDLALAMEDMGRAAAARAAYDRAVEADPDYAHARYNRAGIRASEGDAAGALADLDALLEADPTHLEALGMRGALRAQSGAREDALVDLTQALEQAPAGTVRDQLLLNRGLLFGQLGQHRRAAADLSEVLSRNPNDVAALVNRAAAFSFLGDDERALRDTEAVLSLDPSYYPSWVERARILRDMGRLEEAARAYRDALQRGENPDVRRELEAVEARLGGG